jgi:hypothetical protein
MYSHLAVDVAGDHIGCTKRILFREVVVNDVWDWDLGFPSIVGQLLAFVFFC